MLVPKILPSPEAGFLVYSLQRCFGGDCFAIGTRSLKIGKTKGDYC